LCGALIDETDADVATIAMAIVAVDESYSLHRLNDAIDAARQQIDGQLQLASTPSSDLLHSRVVWYVRHVDFSAGLEAVISRYRPLPSWIAAGLHIMHADIQAGAAKRPARSDRWRRPAELPASAICDVTTRSRSPNRDGRRARNRGKFCRDAPSVRSCRRLLRPPGVLRQVIVEPGGDLTDAGAEARGSRIPDRRLKSTWTHIPDHAGVQQILNCGVEAELQCRVCCRARSIASFSR